MVHCVAHNLDALCHGVFQKGSTSNVSPLKRLFFDKHEKREKIQNIKKVRQSNILLCLASGSALSRRDLWGKEIVSLRESARGG